MPVVKTATGSAPIVSREIGRRRKTMSMAQRELRELRELREHGESHARALRLVDGRQDLSGVSYRTCTHCGEYAAFVREGTDSWYLCGACGRYA
jgi:hypothetical protein